MRYYPIIIIGMHRSGTTMLTKHLEQLGLFVGKKKESNNEALFFLKLNNWLLRQCDARWDYPMNFTKLDLFPDLKHELIEVAEYHLSSYRSLEFIGLNQYLRYHSIKNLPIPWGWKDPRNTFTIDLWKEIFPEAKIIHIYRNPIDVAQSLRKREQKRQQNYQNSFKKKVKKKLLKRNLGYVHSMRVLDIYGGIGLWEEYVKKALDIEKQYEQDCLSICYEKYLEAPRKYLEQIGDFIHIHFDTEKIKQVNNTINNSRKYAFLGQEDLEEVYANIWDNQYVQLLGYDRIKKMNENDSNSEPLMKGAIDR